MNKKWMSLALLAGVLFRELATSATMDPMARAVTLKKDTS